MKKYFTFFWLVILLLTGHTQVGMAASGRSGTGVAFVEGSQELKEDPAVEVPAGKAPSGSTGDKLLQTGEKETEIAGSLVGWGLAAAAGLLLKKRWKRGEKQ